MSAGSRMSLPVVLCLAAALAIGCSSTGKTKKDYGPFVEEDIPATGDVAGDSEQPPDAPVVTFVAPAYNAILSVGMPATLSAKVAVNDPLKKLKRLVFEFDPGTGGDRVVVGEATPPAAGGQIEQALSMTGVPDGNLVLWCRAETDDGRTGSSSVQVIVDNTPPVITAIEPTPPDGGNFVGDLRLHFRFDDQQGIGVKSALVTVAGTDVWSFPTEGNPIVAVVDTDDPSPVVVSTKDWSEQQAVEVKAVASDAAGNVSAEVKFTVTFVPTPAFTAGVRSSLDPAARAVAGLRVAGTDAVALLTDGMVRVRVWARGDTPVRDVDVPIDATANAVQVADMNADGLDDLVVVFAQSVRVFAQSAEGAFADYATFTASDPINAVATGDVNGDGYPDVVAVLNAPADSLAIAASKPAAEAGKVAWWPFGYYGGVAQPTMVAVGRVLGNPGKDIVVAKAGSPVVTVFPVDAATGTPTGGQDSIQMIDGEPATALNQVVIASLPFVQSKPGGGTETVVTPLAVFSETRTQALVLTHAEGITKPPTVFGVLPTGLNPRRILAGDVDGDADGLNDVVVLCEGANMVQVFAGDRQATLKEGSALLTGNRPIDLALSDYDGDGHADIVVLDQDGRNLTILAWQGPGRFQGHRMVNLGVKAPKSLAAGQFTWRPANHAGLLDVAVLGQNGDDESVVEILASDADWRLPTYIESTHATSPVKQPVGLIAADINGKDLTDLVVTSNGVGPATSDTPIATLGLLLFKAVGSSHQKVGFDAKSFYGGDAPKIVQVADLDRSESVTSSPLGTNDLAVASVYPVLEAGEKVARFALHTFLGLGDGVGTFKPGKVYPITDADLRKPSAMVAAKLTTSSKGYYDVALANGGTGDFMVFYHSGGLGYLEPTQKDIIAVGSDPIAIASEYMDGPADGLRDVVVLLPGGFAVSYGVGDASASAKLYFSASQTVEFQAGNGPVALAVADMNGDRFPDVVVLNRSSNTVSIHLNLGARQYGEAVVLPTGVGPEAFLVTDLDGDGCNDIATLDATGGSVSYLRSTLCGK